MEDGNTQPPTSAPEAVLLIADGEDGMAVDEVSGSSDDLRTAYDSSQPRDRTDEGPCLIRFTMNGLIYSVRSDQVRTETGSQGFHHPLAVGLTRLTQRLIQEEQSCDYATFDQPTWSWQIATSLTRR